MYVLPDRRQPALRHLLAQQPSSVSAILPQRFRIIILVRSMFLFARHRITVSYHNSVLCVVGLRPPGTPSTSSGVLRVSLAVRVDPPPMVALLEGPLMLVCPRARLRMNVVTCKLERGNVACMVRVVRVAAIGLKNSIFRFFDFSIMNYELLFKNIKI